MNVRPARRSGIGLYAAVFVVHFVLLIVVIPHYSGRLTPLYNQNKSTDGYDVLASNLVSGVGYRFEPETASTLMREPGYPVFLAGIFLVAGKSFTAIKLANIFLAVATAGLVSVIARKLSTSRVVVLGAPLLFVFHPGTLIAESRAGVETLFAFLLTLFILTLYRALESQRGWDYVLSGGVLGLAVQVKSIPMLFPFCLMAYVLVAERHRVRRSIVCRNIALMLAAMLAVLSPWIIRNYRLTGRLVPAASVLGVSAHAGQYIVAHLSSESRWVDLDHDAARERSRLATELGYQFKGVYYQYFYISEDELRFSSYLLHKVVGRYKQSPMLFVKCVGFNFFNYWVGGKTWQSTIMNLAIQVPYLTLALLGAIVCIRSGRRTVVAPLILIVLYSVIVTIPILAQARYSVPVIPFISLLASVGLAAAGARIAGLRNSEDRLLPATV